MCTFCIIPFARGRARSRDFGNILAEASNLVSRGVRELVLTGVNLGTYSHSGHEIIDIVDALDDLDELLRIRISSIEPTTIPEALFERMADPVHALLPYLHIPLQAGSNEILQAMRRKYSLKEFLTLWIRLTPLCLILCRYRYYGRLPGETDELFEQSCATFMDGPFAYCHVFTYSEREGTVAARRKDHVTVSERKRRSAHLRRLSAMKRHEFHEAYLGREFSVLFEDPREGTWPGYTPNYIRVVVPDAGENLANRRGHVRLSL